MRENENLLAAFLLGTLAIIMAFSVGIAVNQYTINSYIFPLFGVERVLGYWQTFFFNSIWSLLLYSSYTAYVEKYKNLVDKMAFLFVLTLITYALQYVMTWVGIQITL